jgi:predicted Zn-dependent protease
MPIQAVTETQADALRADFLAYNERVADARPLLDRVLQEDPKNVLAHETMGFLEFHAGHLEEARKWYEQAVKLDSQSYLAHYYFAAISMHAGVDPGDDAQVESSLRAAIRLNPSFAPAFDRLAAFEGMQHQNLEEAHMMALTATQLDPGNAMYRVTGANVLMEMERAGDAEAVLRDALRVAKSAEETATIQNFLTHVEEYAAARDEEEERSRRVEEELRADAQANAEFAGEDNAGAGAHGAEPPKGPHRFMVGKLQNVHCHDPRIDLRVASNGKTLALHSGNLYKIVFTAIGFTPKGGISPCKDLEGVSAKVEYVESAAKPATGYVVAIEVHK